MIYLIDDNQNNRRKKNGIDFVDDGVFAEFLNPVDKIEKREKASDISHLAFLQDADCILMHASTEDWSEEKGFLSGSLSNVRKIKEEIADFGETIPLVLFSNGMTETIYSPEENPNLIIGMNKDVFYDRLYDFIENYKNTNAIEFKILAWGKNFRAREIAVLSNRLLESIALLNATEIIPENVISDNKDFFQSFIEKAYTDTNHLEVFNDWKGITIENLRNKLNSATESFLKYGKNIYSWKQ